MDYKDYSRREILDKAEYYRSIGKTAHQKKLEDYVKAMDYGTDGFGVPYKKCSDSELKKSVSYTHLTLPTNSSV